MSESTELNHVVYKQEKNASKLPVVFWIYGGGFINGCADWWPQYWMDEDIVVVIPNYRVGPFGFLGTLTAVI